MNRLYKVEVIDRYMLKCTFFNGDVKEFDVEDYLKADLDGRSKRMLGYCKQIAAVKINNLCTGIELVLENENSGALEKGETDAILSKMDYSYRFDAETLWCEGLLVEQIIVDDINIRLAEWIVAMRECRGMTQAQLAKVTGIHQAEISKLERGLANPSFSTIKKVADGLDYTPVIYFENKRNKVGAVPDTIRQYIRLYKPQGEYTIEDIENFPEDVRCELIDGKIYDMCMPSIVHQIYILEIGFQFMDYIKKNGGKCKTVLSPFALRFEDDDKSLLAPDLAVVCNPDIITEKEVCGAPDFILEVVSPSNGKRDYVEKCNIYREKGVRECWILDPVKEKLLVYQFDVDDMFPTIYGIDGKVPVGIYEGKLEIDLGGIREV